MKPRKVVAYLAIRNHPTIKNRIAIYEGENVIGRVPEKSNIVVKDGQVSSAHAKLVVENSKITLTDLGSKNGTFINLQSKQRLQKGVPTQINQEQYFALGEVQCAVELIKLGIIRKAIISPQKNKQNTQKVLFQLQQSSEFVQRNKIERRVIAGDSRSSSINSSKPVNIFSKEGQEIYKERLGKSSEGECDIFGNPKHSASSSNQSIAFPKPKSVPLKGNKDQKSKKDKNNQKDKQQKSSKQKKSNQQKSKKPRQSLSKKQLQQKSKKQKQLLKKKPLQQKQQEKKRNLDQQRQRKQEDFKEQKLPAKKKEYSKKAIEKEQQKIKRNSDSIQNQLQNDDKKKQKKSKQPSKGKSEQNRSKQRRQSLQSKKTKNESKQKNEKRQGSKKSQIEQEKQEKRESKQKKQMKKGVNRLLQVPRQSSGRRRESTSGKSTSRSQKRSVSSESSKKGDAGLKTRKRVPKLLKSRLDDNQSSGQIKAYRLRQRLMKRTKFMVSGEPITFMSSPMLELVTSIEKDYDILVMEKYIRTFKLLFSIVRGIPVVGKSWLTDSEYYRKPMEVDGYWLAHPDDKELIKRSVLRAQSGYRPLRDRKFYIGFGQQKLNMPLGSFEKLVYASGGDIVSQLRDIKGKKSLRNEIIILLTENYDQEQIALAREINKDNIYLVEMVLQSCLTMEVEMEKYRVKG